MAKKPTVTTVASGYYGRTALNDNFTALRDGFGNTLSLDGSTPNAMGADLDMNSNDVLNVTDMRTSRLFVNGVQVSSATLVNDATVAEVDTVALLVADTNLTYTTDQPRTVAVGDYVRTVDEGFVYEVAASGATDHDVTTAGGVKLYVRRVGDDIPPELLGAVGDGSTDSTLFFQRAVAAFPRRQIRADADYAINNLFLDNNSLTGNGKLIAATGADYVVALGNDNTDQWRYARVSDIYIDGNSKASDGIEFNNGGTSDELAGRWIIDGAFVKNCDKGISKPSGNIGNIITGTTLRNNNYGYHAVGQVSPIMHAGADIIQGGEVSGNSLAGIYIDSPIDGTGGLVLDGVIIETNPGFGLFVKSWEMSYTPLTLRNVWFEANHTSGSVTIDAVSYTPRDIYFNDVAYAVIDQSNILDCEFINSNVVMRDCFFNDTTAILATGGYLRAQDANIDGMKGQSQLLVESVSHSRRAAGNAAASWWAPSRKKVVRQATGGTVAEAISFDGQQPVNSGGTTTISGTQRVDGITFDRCTEFTIPNGNTNLFGSSFTITTGKWYVYSLDMKMVSGAIPAIDLVSGVPMAIDLEQSYDTAKGGWRTIAGIAKAGATGTVALQAVNSTGAASTIRFSAYQVIEFDTEEDALAFYNSGMYMSDWVLENYGTGTFTTGAAGNFLIPHGMSRIPTHAVVEVVGATSNRVNISSVDATNITGFLNDASGAGIGSASVDVSWQARA